MLDPLAEMDALQNSRLLTKSFRRHENRDRLADDFFSVIAEELFGAAVPTGNDPVVVLAYDRVSRRFNNGSQTARGLLRAPGLGDIQNHIDRAHDFSRSIPNRIGMRQHDTTGSIRTRNDDFLSAHGPALLQG